MGAGRAECVEGCTCEGALLEGTWDIRATLMSVASLEVRPAQCRHDACRQAVQYQDTLHRYYKEMRVGVKLCRLVYHQKRTCIWRHAFLLRIRPTGLFVTGTHPDPCRMAAMCPLPPCSPPSMPGAESE